MRPRAGWGPRAWRGSRKSARGSAGARWSSSPSRSAPDCGSSCVAAAVDGLSAAGVPAGTNPYSIATPEKFPNEPGCVAYRSDIFDRMGLPGRGEFEARCVAAFLGEPYAVSRGCTADGFPIVATFR